MATNVPVLELKDNGPGTSQPSAPNVLNGMNRELTEGEPPVLSVTKLAPTFALSAPTLTQSFANASGILSKPLYADLE